jgi:hypothetical protein
MTKLKASDIFIPGAKLKVDKIDFSDPEIKKQFDKIREENKKILAQRKIDWQKFANTIIAI